MDIRLLLATEPSHSYEDRSARSKAIRSPSLDTTHSASTTAATTSIPLRRDAARVLQGVFDAHSNPSSRAASPSMPPPVRSATASEHATPMPPLPLQTKSRRPQRLSSKSSYGPSTCNVQPPVTKSLPTASCRGSGPPIGSSFSYTPLPADYFHREAEYDYAAAQDYMESIGSDTDTEPEEPETPPLDYMGTGTPIITPRLMAKVMQAKAAGRSLQVSSSVPMGLKKFKEKKSRKNKDGEKEAKGKGKEKGRGRTKSVAGRDGSRAFSVDSNGQARKASHSGHRPDASGKRSRADEDGANERPDKKHRGPSSDASSTPTAAENKSRPKGWKGWALIEVSSSEDERANLYDEEGRRLKSQTADTESLGPSESETDSEAERAKQKPGWKGWALVKNPPDRSKLIKLDAPPMVLTSRSTRSGRAFGDGNWDDKIMGGGGANPRGASTGSNERRGSRLSTAGSSRS